MPEEALIFSKLDVSHMAVKCERKAGRVGYVCSAGSSSGRRG